MKGLLRAGGVAVILGTLILGGRLWSEPKKAPTPPRTRIAMINLSYVLKNYTRYKNFQADMKADIDMYQEKDKEIRELLKKCMATIADPEATDEEKAKCEKSIVKYRRQLEDVAAEAKKMLGKRSDDQMVLLYKEIQKAAMRYAKAHDIEMVLHFNDADEKKDTKEYWSSANVARKMQAGALMPLYATPGIDISEELAEAMNNDFRAEK